MKRRTFLAATAAGGAALAMPALKSQSQMRLESGQAFEPLSLLDATGGELQLEAQTGQTAFAGGAPSPTKGFNGAYLGPVIRMRRGGTIAARVSNRTSDPVSCHWHGLNVPSKADGGAHQSIIAPDATWFPELPIDQPAATLWYHTHVHGRVAPDIHAGLAGAIIVEDEQSDALDLPSRYGVDDLTLILQDKSFDGDGRPVYDPDMMGVMHGMVGDTVLANGQLAPEARVPAGLVRLRLINACTGALLRISGAEFAVIATDQGLLSKPHSIREVAISPGERVEIVTDLSDATAADLKVSAGPASGMGGMMSGGGMMDGMGMGRGGRNSRQQTLIRLAPDLGLASSGPLPGTLTAFEPPENIPNETSRTFHLAAQMGPGMMVRRLFGAQTMTINGESFNPDRIDFTAKAGAIERWRVTGAMMGHPFHVHGAKFLIADPQRPEEMGWKDTAMINGARDLIVKIEARSEDQIPFMYHCHILEHEDAGMMGQFLVA